MMEKFCIIKEKDLLRLLEKVELYEALIDGGVMGWDGYQSALDEYLYIQGQWMEHEGELDFHKIALEELKEYRL